MMLVNYFIEDLISWARLDDTNRKKKSVRKIDDMFHR